jgi:hypothetical protein
MADQRNVSGGLLPGTWFEYQDVWQLGSQASCRSGYSVACVGSGNDQTNAYAGEYMRLRGQGDHVLELPSTVSPHWLGELLKCL